MSGNAIVNEPLLYDAMDDYRTIGTVGSRWRSWQEKCF